MLIIFAGGIGRSVTGGQAWANLQYLIGLRELGHDVYYLEDCGDWSNVYNWETAQTEWELDYPAAYVNDCLMLYGLGEHWIYRAGDDSRGIPLDGFRELMSRADLFIIRGIPMLRWREEFDWPARRAFIDVDPGFTQFCYARGEPAYVETIDKSEALYSVGASIGTPSSSIPTLDRRWRATVSPVVLSQWQTAPDNNAADFTSVIRWRGMKDMTHKGVKYGQRNQEFAKFMDLPSWTEQTFSIALTGGGMHEFRARGWNPLEGWTVSRTPDLYRDFIRRSRAEFGVAKNTYVDTRGGWFSDRSACYIAAGRPVLLQDTGVGDWLPIGSGVVTFNDIDSAVRGIESINADYPSHRSAARRIAEEYFSTNVVLPNLVASAVD